MASDYGLNFGFRRSDESMATREGRFKTPVGSALLQGSAVVIDPAVPGYMKQAETALNPVTGVHGLLVQEDDHLHSIYDNTTLGHDSFNLGVCKPNKLSVIWSGAGTKFWLQNTAGQTRADGRVIAAKTVVTVAGIAVGDSLGWNGTLWVEVAAGATAWATVTNVDVAAGYLEAVLKF